MRTMKTLILTALILAALYGAACVARIEIEGRQAEAFLKQQCDAGNVEACKPI